MQHGFAARNGLLAALLARANYTGIERVLELPYGGFFTCFGRQSQSPPPNPHFSTLGTEWETNNILTKPYPLMATLHAPVDCIRLLQAKHKAQLAITENITSIKIEQAEAAFAHGGWRVNDRSIEVTGAQMSAAYAVALQLTDGEVVPTSFKADKVNRPALFDLIWKTDCMHQPAFDGEGMKLKTRVTICFEGGGEVVGMVEEPRGVEPKMSEGEVLGKWGDGVLGLVGERRCKVIEEGVMGLEKLKGLGELLGELKGEVGSVLD